MADSTVVKVDSSSSPRGPEGQRYLAMGKALSMRLRDEQAPEDDAPERRRDYETVGFVISGRAELHVEGSTVALGPGDSWVVPKGAAHRYVILEPFTAVEATHPPAEVHDRDR